jgi:urease subunit alpha
MMLRSFEGLPVNVGILAEGSSAGEAALVEQVLAGAAGFKVHEDWGATPASIRAALSVANSMDVQISLHTDTQNEAGFVEDTIAAFDGRTIHTFHSEGVGGGHSPDLLRVVGEG